MEIRKRPLFYYSHLPGSQSKANYSLAPFYYIPSCCSCKWREGSLKSRCLFIRVEDALCVHWSTLLHQIPFFFFHVQVHPKKGKPATWLLGVMQIITSHSLSPPPSFALYTVSTLSSSDINMHGFGFTSFQRHDWPNAIAYAMFYV